MTLATARRLGRHRAVAVVWCLALIALLHAGGSLPHAHTDVGPGYYNLDHDLSYLATFGLSAPLPEASTAVPLDAAIGALAVDRVRDPAITPVGHAASRAPPLPSRIAS